MPESNKILSKEEKLRDWAKNVQEGDCLRVVRDAMALRSDEVKASGPTVDALVTLRQLQLEISGMLIKLEAAGNSVMTSRVKSTQLRANVPTLTQIPETMGKIREKLQGMGVQETPELASALETLGNCALSAPDKRALSLETNASSIWRR